MESQELGLDVSERERKWREKVREWMREREKERQRDPMQDPRYVAVLALQTERERDPAYQAAVAGRPRLQPQLKFNDNSPEMPHMVAARKRNLEIAAGLYKPYPSPEYISRQVRGFYADFNELDDSDDSHVNYQFKKIVCSISSSLVALSSQNLTGLQINSAGMVIEYGGMRKILTSGYIIEGHAEPRKKTKVNVFLSDGKSIPGTVSCIDEYHNIVLIDADIDKPAFRISTELVDLGVDVIALGRHSKNQLMASKGKINTRKDDLDSDDLMSSSCTISEFGIGGPLILSTGELIGMNVWGKKKSTSFIPSTIFFRCIEFLLTNGEVLRPYLGFRTRNLNELKLGEFEALYQKFPSTNGILVTKVVNQAEGIEIGDIITKCDDKFLSSPVELAEYLLELGKMSLVNCTTRRMGKNVKLVIQRSGTTVYKTINVNQFRISDSNGSNRWPALPICLLNDYQVLQHMHMVGSHPNAATMASPHPNHTHAAFFQGHNPMYGMSHQERSSV